MLHTNLYNSCIHTKPFNWLKSHISENISWCINILSGWRIEFNLYRLRYINCVSDRKRVNIFFSISGKLYTPRYVCYQTKIEIIYSVPKIFETTKQVFLTNCDRKSIVSKEFAVLVYSISTLLHHRMCSHYLQRTHESRWDNTQWLLAHTTYTGEASLHISLAFAKHYPFACIMRTHFTFPKGVYIYICIFVYI